MTELNLLRECAAALLDAADMMNDGPDESDVAYAEGKITLAVTKAKAARDLLPESEIDEFVGLPMITDDGE